MMKNWSAKKSWVIAVLATAGVTALVASRLTVASAAQAATAQPSEWKQWGGDTGVSRFSPLDQITADIEHCRDVA